MLCYEFMSCQRTLSRCSLRFFHIHGFDRRLAANLVDNTVKSFTDSVNSDTASRKQQLRLNQSEIYNLLH